MTKQSVTIITPPDDIFVDSLRILTVNLDNSQKSIISNALTEATLEDQISIYMWENDKDFDWFCDKKLKADIIIFNADLNDSLTGYLAAQKNSYYFGILRNLNKFNNKCLHTKYDFMELINKF